LQPRFLLCVNRRDLERKNTLFIIAQILTTIGYVTYSRFNCQGKCVSRENVEEIRKMSWYKNLLNLLHY